MTTQTKPLTDRQKVELWLNHIHEFDPACREEVLLACKIDLTARKYYLMRWEQDCACATS